MQYCLRDIPAPDAAAFRCLWCLVSGVPPRRDTPDAHEDSALARPNHHLAQPQQQLQQQVMRLWMFQPKKRGSNGKLHGRASTAHARRTKATRDPGARGRTETVESLERPVKFETFEFKNCNDNGWRAIFRNRRL